ncbi:putative secondary metabolism biosynthetic enzyme [Pestalotiopsis sp. IQ-011]
MATRLTAEEASETLQPNLIALCVIMLTLSTLALSLRMWSNYINPAHNWWWDDFFAVITLPFIIAETGLIFWWIKLGLGKHAATTSPEDLAKGPKIIFIAAFLYDSNISLPKFSALFFYRRIFQRTNIWFTAALWTVSIMNAGWLLSAWLSTVFQCTPVNAAWETVPGSTCISQWGWFFGTAIPSMIIDLCILILPLPLLWGLRASPARRFLVGVVFLCGYSVIVVSIGRLVTLASAGTHLLDDLTWTTVTYLEWVQCEGPISLISVCLPSIIYLTKSIKEKVANNTHGTRGTSKTFRSSTASQQDQLVTMDDYSPLQQSSSQKQVKNYSPLQQSGSPRQVEEGLHRQELAV